MYVIIFNNKMHDSSALTLNADPLISPKETQERQIRALALQKIDCEIERILSLNRHQQTQFKDLPRQLAAMENLYKKENKQLRQEVAQLKEHCNQLQKLYLATKQELEGVMEQLEEQREKRALEVGKLKSMVSNQEQLIDDYKKSIVDELQLERELMKATFQEERAKMERHFNHALLQMEKHHEDKLKKALREAKIRDCHNEFQGLKKYLKNNKENQQEPPIKKSPSCAIKIVSEYSTTDQQSREIPRHNHPIFIS